MSTPTRSVLRAASRFFIIGCFAVGLLLANAATVQAQSEGPIAFVGATLHPISGPPISNGVLVVEGQHITALGASGSVSVPAGAERIDLGGKHIYPGFIQAASLLGLVEIGSVRGTDDTQEMGDINSHLRAEVAFNADSLLLLPAIRGGVLTANIMPTGGLIAGSGAAMRLQGWNWEDMALATPTGMHINFPSSAPPRHGHHGDDDDGDDKVSEGRRILDEAFANARIYRDARAAIDDGGAPVDRDPRLEALLPVLGGETPVYLHVDRKKDILDALEWADKEELSQLVLVANMDVAYVAEELAKRDVPVILTNIHSEPDRDWEPYDTPFTAAARLHAAGVRFAFTGEGDPSQARTLPFQVATSIAFGLPKDAALRGLTLGAAEILGIADRVGSLDTGKEATFFVSDGDPLEIMTSIEAAWIAGNAVDFTKDRQEQLYLRYLNRPKPVHQD